MEALSFSAAFVFVNLTHGFFFWAVVSAAQAATHQQP
jgi:hypothetical protein